MGNSCDQNQLGTTRAVHHAVRGSYAILKAICKQGRHVHPEETTHTIFVATQKMPTTNSSPSSSLATKQNERKIQSLFGIRQVLPMRQVSWAKVSGCFEFHQLTLAAFSLPKGSKVKHRLVLCTLKWGWVVNNKWCWNGPHAVIFFHNHFHTNSHHSGDDNFGVTPACKWN